MPDGMVNTKIATSSDATSAMIAAICACTLPVAIRNSSVTTGMAAMLVDSVALPSGL